MSSQPLEKITLSRRSVLRTGLVGTLMLGGVSALSTLQGCQQTPLLPPPNDNFRVLRPRDRVILGAIAPVVLAGAFPQDRPPAVQTFLPQIDSFLFSTNTVAHDALHQLFDALDTRPVRWALTGIWSRWEDVTDDQVEALLTRWKSSSIKQLRIGYGQLSQIINLVWYAQPANTRDIYPGSPDHNPPALALSSFGVMSV